MLSIKTILHPTDFSEQSRRAFAVACALARDYGAHLTVMHVVPPGTIELIALTQLGTEENTGSVRETFWADLRKIRATDSAIRVEHRLEDGDPAAEILGVAQEIHADLIVMGTHGRTGLGRILMGSVAEQVVRQAVCPVLTVKTPLHDAFSTSQAPVEAAAH
jgi:nucleotide-binding universal stress UspA family protein